MDAILQEEDQQSLNGLFLQRLLFLESVASGMSTGSGVAIPSGQSMAKDIRDFMAYLKHVAYNITTFNSSASDCPEGNRKSSQDMLINTLHIIHLHFSASSVGGTNNGIAGKDQNDNSFSFAATSEDSDVNSCLFHLTLDWNWTLLSCIHFLGKRGSATSTMPDFVLFQGHQPTGVICEGEGKMGEIKRVVCLNFMAQLLSLSEERFNAVSTTKTTPSKLLSTSPFQCSCVKELWFLTMSLMELDFWKLLRVHLSSQQKTSDVGVLDKCAGHSVCDIKLLSSHVCSWWLLHGLVSQVNVDAKGAERPLTKCRTVMRLLTEAKLLEQDLIKKTTASQREKLNETELRVIVSAASKTSLMLSGPRFLTMSSFLEFFLKFLNNPFADKRMGATGQVQVLPESLHDWTKKLGCDSSPSTRLDESNSFQLFLDALDDIAEGKRGHSGKLFPKLCGRLKLWLTPVRLRELNDVGWFHFFQLMLTMARGCAAVGKVEHAKWLGFCVQLLKDFDSATESNTRSKVILMGTGVLIVIALSSDVNATPLVETFMNRLNQTIERFFKVSNDATKIACQEAVRVYTDLIQEGLDATRSHQGVLIRHTSLVSPFFAKYLDKCLPSEVDRLAATLGTLAAGMGRYYKESEQRLGWGWTKEQVDMHKEINATHEAMWKNIFPAIEQNLCNNNPTTASCDKLAELCTLLVRPKDLQS